MVSCTKVRRSHCAYAPECACGSAYARMRMRMHKGLYVCIGYAGMRVCGYAGMLLQMPTCCMRACAFAYAHRAVYALGSAGMRIRGGVCAVARLFNDRDGASAQLHSYTSTQLHIYTATQLHICVYPRIRVCIVACLHGFVYEGSSRTLRVCSRVRMR